MVLPEVFEAMRPFYTEYYGNPSSPHQQGLAPAALIRKARKSMAGLLGCDDGELIFTSCGTESDNMAILGAAEMAGASAHFITTTVEHPAVLNVFKRLQSLGHDVTYLRVNMEGQIDLDELKDALRDDTALVSIMYANNETGVILPMREIVDIVKERGVLFHSDVVQAIGKVSIDVSSIPMDMIAMSAHKFHGPKGVGALFVRRGTRSTPGLLGGGQEHGRRAGTENVAGIAAMAKAFELAHEHLEEYGTRVRALRDKFESALLKTVPDSFVPGASSERLPNTSNICFRGVDNNALLLLLDEVGICASAGSACKSGAGVPSGVLVAMGLPPEDASSAMRFSLSTLTSDADIDYALGQIPAVVKRMRDSAQSR